MKLLSRFIWLIIGILAIVFTGVTLFQIKANSEFELIKNSIKEEYDVQVDKMLTPDPYSIGFTSFMSDICNASASAVFLSEDQPADFYINEYLVDDLLDYHNVDAVWFFDNNGSQFYFKSSSKLTENQMPIPEESIPDVLASEDLMTFYNAFDSEVVYYHGAKIAHNIMGHTGYVVMGSIMNEKWIDEYTNEINNSQIDIYKANEQLPETDKKTIRITRDLDGYDGDTQAILNIELHLPFLQLWSKTNNTDKWIMTGSMVIVVFFLIIFLVVWVISPLKKVSASLERGTSKDIQPLLKGSTEMSDVARMINDYHKKTEELEASESVKRHIFEQAQVGILIADVKNGIVATTNPYACKLINSSEEAILGNAIDNYLEGADAEYTEGHESTLFNSSGEEITILRTRTKMMMEGQQVYMNTFVDLSEIKTLQDKLEDEKKKLSLAVQNSGLIFCEYDFKKDEIQLDENWMFLTKGKNKNIGQNIMENIYESDKKLVNEKIDSILKGAKNALEAEFRIEHPQRGIVWLSVSILITQRDENHQPKQLISLVEDITERIIVQQELIKAKEKAEESDRMKSSYLGNMSHKIRTPLNTIVGFANLLTEEEIETVEKENYINIIRNDTEQVLHLIDDIINIAKIDAQQLDINKKSQNANKIIEDLANYYKTNEKTSKVRFNIKTMLPDGKDVLQTDADKLNQVMSSLLNNAFKFTHEGSIELGYFINPVDKKMIMYVKDTGIGIPKEKQEKIFNRFFQVNPMSEGTGLGLTISQSIVKLLDGKLYFDSKEDEGSTFYVELPFSEA